jgi:hypothetical protein
MEQSPSCEVKSHLACQEIPRLLCNPDVQYCVHKTPHLSLSRARCINSTNFQPISLRFILILPYLLRLDPPSSVLHSGFPTKILYVFLRSTMRATFPPISSSLIYHNNICYEPG